MGDGWYRRQMGRCQKTVAEVCQRLSCEQYWNFSKNEGFILRWFSFSSHLHLWSFSPAALDLTALPPLTLFFFLTPAFALSLFLLLLCQWCCPQFRWTNRGKIMQTANAYSNAAWKITAITKYFHLILINCNERGRWKFLQSKPYTHT